MYVEKSFQTKSGTLNYAEGPASGPPLLLLHGVTANWTMFTPMLATLSQRWHVFAPDFRGHGKSSHVSGRYQFTNYAEDIPPFIESTFSEPPVILGASLGGMVGILVAANYPEQVRALIVGDSLLYPETIAQWREQVGDTQKRREEIDAAPPVKEMAEIFRQSPPERRDGWNRWAAHSYLQLDSDILNFQGAEDIAKEYNCAELLPKIQCPVLLIQAFIMQNDADRALSQLQDGYIARFGDLGHLMDLEPEGYQVLNEICLFLESLR
ncbi:MAG: alpha/beta fold hydrolase [Candidatus Latescibacteria bacterium]|nr:alpha/beta fold hydrolase [Candidatus Latescibacterota bacterium]